MSLSTNLSAAQRLPRRHVPAKLEALDNGSKYATLLWRQPNVSRICPECDKPLTAFTVRCSCGYTLAESRDLRSDPDEPRCNVCDEPMGLMDQRCPSCKAFGYPALRPRQGKKCKHVGDGALLIEKRD